MLLRKGGKWVHGGEEKMARMSLLLHAQSSWTDNFTQNVNEAYPSIQGIKKQVDCQASLKEVEEILSQIERL